MPLGKSGLTVRQWPPRYLTPRVRLYLALWQQQQKGRVVRPDAVMLWPARLVNVLSAIDAWPPLGSRNV